MVCGLSTYHLDLHNSHIVCMHPVYGQLKIWIYKAGMVIKGLLVLGG